MGAASPQFWGQKRPLLITQPNVFTSFYIKSLNIYICPLFHLCTKISSNGTKLDEVRTRIKGVYLKLPFLPPPSFLLALHPQLPPPQGPITKKYGHKHGYGHETKIFSKNQHSTKATTSQQKTKCLPTSSNSAFTKVIVTNALAKHPNIIKGLKLVSCNIPHVSVSSSILQLSPW